MTAAKQPEAETLDGAHDEPGLRPMLTERMVLDLVPLSRTTLYRLERAGKFPRSVYASPNRRFWFRDQVIAWQRAINERDERNPNRGRGVASVFHLVRPSAKLKLGPIGACPEKGGPFLCQHKSDKRLICWGLLRFSEFEKITGRQDHTVLPSAAAFAKRSCRTVHARQNIPEDGFSAVRPARLDDRSRETRPAITSRPTLPRRIPPQRS